MAEFMAPDPHFSYDDEGWYIISETLRDRRIALAQAKALIAWGEKDCMGHDTPSGKFRALRPIPRQMCLTCWEQFKQEVNDDLRG